MKRTFKTITVLALLLAVGGFAQAVDIPRTIQINTGNGKAVIRDKPDAAQAAPQIQATPLTATQTLPLVILPSAMMVIPTTLPSSKSTNYDLALGKSRIFLTTGVAEQVNRTNNPAAFVLPDRLNLVDIIESTTASLWYEFNRPGYGGERGSITPYAVSVKRSQIRLSNLQITIASSDTHWAVNILGAVHRFNDINYSLNTVGVIYVNGVNTNGGVTLVTSGPPTQIVDEIRFTGYSSDFLANTPQERSNVYNYVDGQPSPFTVTARYDLFDDDGSTLVYAVKVWSVVPYQAVRSSLGIAKVCGSGGAQDCQLQVSIFGDHRESYTIQSSTLVDRGWSDYLTVNCPVGPTVFYIPATTGSARFFK